MPPAQPPSTCPLGLCPPSSSHTDGPVSQVLSALGVTLPCPVLLHPSPLPQPPAPVPSPSPLPLSPPPAPCPSPPPSLPLSRTTCPPSSQAQGPGGTFACPLGPAGGREPRGSHDQALWAGSQTPGAAPTNLWALARASPWGPRTTRSPGLPPSQAAFSRPARATWADASGSMQPRSRPPALALLQSASFYLMGLHGGSTWTVWRHFSQR